MSSTSPTPSPAPPPTARGPIGRARRGPSDLTVLGGLITVLGAVLLLGELEVLDGTEVLHRAWPLAPLTFGVLWLWRGPRIGGAIATFFGTVWLLVRNDVVPGPVAGLIWPVILVALGLTIVVTAIRVPRGGSVPAGGRPVALFDTRRWAGPFDEFAGATLTAVFGDVDLRLREPASAPSVQLTALSIFGDVDLVVPSGWRVRDGVTSVFGSVRVPSTQPDWPEAPVLELHGLTLFGDVDVRHEDA